nr:probable protein S-acyltransferase 16 [Ipomoea batatas]
MGGAKLSFRISSVISSIIFVYFATVFGFIERCFGLWSSLGMLNAVSFTAVVLLGICSYSVAMFTDPGRVPASYMPSHTEHDDTIQEIKRKDHHCFWMNNCVGYANYKAFFISTVYAVIASTHSLVLLVCSLAMGSKGDHTNGGSHITIYVISCFEGVRAKSCAQRGAPVYSHPYDLGPHQNFREILGPNILCWLCPYPITRKNIRSGLQFRTAFDKMPRPRAA